MLIAGEAYFAGPIKTNVGPPIRAVTFSANGNYLVSGDQETVRVWRVGDEAPVATMAVGVVNCLAVSKNGRRIAAGRYLGDVVVWDAETYEKVITLGDDYVNGVDFSPDSTRLVSASDNRTVTIWDIATGKPVFTPLPHKEHVRAAKFSPQGDRIATATQECVRVFHSTGTLLVDVPVKVTAWYNTGLLWSKNQLFIISDGKIKQIDASTGSTVSEWLVPDTNSSSCIALPQHKEFIAYSTNDTVTFWDTSKHTQLGLIRHPQDIRSMTLSPDDQFIAIGGEYRKITIKQLPRTIVSHGSMGSWRTGTSFLL
jgi:WD40 repeat protein